MGFFGGGGSSVDLASPPAIGSTTPNTGAFTTLSANNGTLTSSSPAFTLAQTWNSAGVVFTALRANVTDTASNSASLLIDLQLGGSSRFSVDKTGSIVSSYGINIGGTNASSPLLVSGTFYLATATVVQWGTAANRLASDLAILKEAANVLSQRNGTNAQTFRLYNTFTSGTNFERLNFRWASNEFILDAEKGSGGGTLRGIKIGSATSSLLGFYGVTPVDQPATVTDPTGGGTQDAEARTAINAIIDRLQELGLIA
jgi:hypothetical protein